MNPVSIFAACAPLLGAPDLVAGEPPPFDAAAAPVSGDTAGDANDKQAAPLWSALRTRELDAFVDTGLARLQVPGAAVAVIQGHELVYERSFGVRALGTKAPVTSETLFMLASTTKPLTTLMMAALVDDGTLTWQTPVQRVLPTFSLADRLLSERVLVWHTVCACSGVPGRDFEHLFEHASVTPLERLATLATVTSKGRLGEVFSYSNLMFAAGGYAAAHAFAPAKPLDEAFEKVMKAKVFDPIGMRSTTMDLRAVQRSEHALPHALSADGRVHAIPLAYEGNVAAIQPAGAVWSNLRDVVRYATTELRRGISPGGARVVSERNLVERWRARLQPGQSGYGLGVELRTLQGVNTIGHAGGALGYGTTVWLVPARGSAVIVLSNVRNGHGSYEHLPFNKVVTQKALELLFGGPVMSRGMLDEFVRARQSRDAALVAGLDSSPPRAWIRSLVGAYNDPRLGNMRIALTRQGGVFDAGEWHSAIGRRIAPDGTVKLVLLDAPFAGGELVVGADKGRRTLTANEDGMIYVFRRL